MMEIKSAEAEASSEVRLTITFHLTLYSTLNQTLYSTDLHYLIFQAHKKHETHNGTEQEYRNFFDDLHDFLTKEKPSSMFDSELEFKHDRIERVFESEFDKQNDYCAVKCVNKNGERFERDKDIDSSIELKGELLNLSELNREPNTIQIEVSNGL